MFPLKVLCVEGVKIRAMVSEEEEMRQQRIKCDKTGVKQRCKARGKALTRESGRGDREEESSWNQERNAGKGNKKKKREGGVDLCNISFNALILHNLKSKVTTYTHYSCLLFFLLSLAS